MLGKGGRFFLALVSLDALDKAKAQPGIVPPAEGKRTGKNRLTMENRSRLFGKTGGGIVRDAVVGQSLAGDWRVWWKDAYHLRLMEGSSLLVESGHERYSLPLSPRGQRKLRAMTAAADQLNIDQP